MSEDETTTKTYPTPDEVRLALTGEVKNYPNGPCPRCLLRRTGIRRHYCPDWAEKDGLTEPSNEQARGKGFRIVEKHEKGDNDGSADTHS